MQPLRDYQSRATQQTLAHYDAGVRSVLLVSPTGSGKCLGKGTPVMLFDGSTKPVEGVCVGDRLMGPDSAPRLVTSVCSGEDDLFRITPVKGHPWVCNSAHVLSLVDTTSGLVTDISLDAYIAKSNTFRHLHKLFRVGVDFPQRSVQLPVSPYFLGVWLGDGNKNLRSVAVSKPDPEILAACLFEAQRFGLKVSTSESGACPTHYITGAHGGDWRDGKRVNPLGAALKRCVSTDFTISADYLCGDRDTRLELLAGLLDTDGHHSNGGFDCVQKLKSIAEGIVFLARSVGLSANMSIKTVAPHGDYYRVSISGDCTIIPIRIPRKKPSARRQVKNCLRTGFSVAPIGRGEYFGFTLEGDGRFLLGDFTVTHNTRMGEEIVVHPRWHHVAWFAHRKELVRDAFERLSQSIGALDVGAIAPGFTPSPFSRIQVASIQTTLRRGTRPHADLLVFDEAHHLRSDEWATVLDSYPDAKWLLLTATPERQDGRAMGAIADRIVVAAEYSELLQAGHLTPVRVYRPEHVMGNALAQDPVDAWQKYSPRGVGFAFFGSVDMAYACEHRMNERGIRAAVVEQKTDKRDRKRYVEQLRSGELDCICNVYTMTEGVDVPRADTVMLASQCRHCGGFLQKTGRGLRVFPGKQFCTVIDLVGATILHGLPTDDRVYSLDGEPIKRKSTTPIKSCPQCGAVIESTHAVCPECSWVFAVKRERSGPRIFSLDLVEVFAGLHTEPDVKRKAYAELRNQQRANGYDLSWVILQYKRVFVEPCVITDATTDEKRAEFSKLRNFAKSKGFKPKFANVQFNRLFGHWPNA